MAKKFLYKFSASNSTEIFESFDNLSPAALISAVDNSTVCGRNPIMGTIVADAAPYLYPFIIEYSLIGAAVIYVMWKHIGRYPRCVVYLDLVYSPSLLASPCPVHHLTYTIKYLISTKNATISLIKPKH